MINPEEIALKLALKKLFKDNYLSICTIDSLLKMTNSFADEKTYKILSTIHCVHYSEMDQEFRQWLFQTVLTMFKTDGFNFTDIEEMNPFFTQNKIIDIK